MNTQEQIADYRKRAAKALKLLEDGYDRAAIAERFGVTVAEVSRMCSDARLERKKAKP